MSSSIFPPHLGMKPIELAKSKTYVFNKLPSLQDWIRLSDEPFTGPQKPSRNSDPALIRIDEIIKALQGQGPTGGLGGWGAVIYMAAKLWFALKYWLHLVDQVRPPMPNLPQKITMGPDPLRKPVVIGLLQYALEVLSQALGCNKDFISTERKLNALYGKSMGTHGNLKDNFEGGSAFNLQLAALEKFHVYFQDGLAYQFGLGAQLKLINMGEDDEWLFSMSNEGDLYAFVGFGGKLSPENVGKIPIYHSNFLSGENVLSAGKIKILHGEIVEIDNKSGHYAPSSDSLVRVLDVLKMNGVDVSKINVGFAGPDVIESVGAFMDAGGITKDSKGNIVWDGKWAALLNQSGDQTYKEFKASNITLPALVKKQYEAQVHHLIFDGKQTEDRLNRPQIWIAAYKAICLEFAKFDPAWKTRVNMPPPLFPSNTPGSSGKLLLEGSGLKTVHSLQERKRVTLRKP